MLSALDAIIGSLILLAFAYLGYMKFTRLWGMRKELRKMKYEEASLERMISHAQDRYFRLNSVGRMDYESMMDTGRAWSCSRRTSAT